MAAFSAVTDATRLSNKDRPWSLNTCWWTFSKNLNACLLIYIYYPKNVGTHVHLLDTKEIKQ